MENNRINQEYPLFVLREELRTQANEVTVRLQRSVGRLTSCDRLPCLEYGEEIEYQRQLAERLFYLQHCRDALEQCIHRKKVVQRYRWRDGSVSVTRFQRIGPARVRVSGFLSP